MGSLRDKGKRAYGGDGPGSMIRPRAPPFVHLLVHQPEGERETGFVVEYVRRGERPADSEGAPMSATSTQLFDVQTRIQESTRRATLRASFIPAPDFDPMPPFRRQAIPTPPPEIVVAHAQVQRIVPQHATELPKAA